MTDELIIHQSTSNVDMKSVFSTFVDKIGYDADTRILHVIYRNGARSRYINVDPEDADKVMTAASVGDALHRFIRGRYNHISQKADE